MTASSELLPSGQRLIRLENHVLVDGAVKICVFNRSNRKYLSASGWASNRRTLVEATAANEIMEFEIPESAAQFLQGGEPLTFQAVYLGYNEDYSWPIPLPTASKPPHESPAPPEPAPTEPVVYDQALDDAADVASPAAVIPSDRAGSARLHLAYTALVVLAALAGWLFAYFISPTPAPTWPDQRKLVADLENQISEVQAMTKAAEEALHEAQASGDVAPPGRGTEPDGARLSDRVAAAELPVGIQPGDTVGKEGDARSTADAKTIGEKDMEIGRLNALLGIANSKNGQLTSERTSWIGALDKAQSQLAESNRQLDLARQADDSGRIINDLKGQVDALNNKLAIVAARNRVLEPMAKSKGIWGALAVSEDGKRYTFAINQVDEAAARRDAVANCSIRGVGVAGAKTCEVLRTYSTGCAAFARPIEPKRKFEAGGFYVGEKGDTLADIKQYAVEDCKHLGYGACEATPSCSPDYLLEDGN